MNLFRTLFRLCICVLMPFGLLIGCNSSSFLSGASSMRIEVDVYKGPLANTKTIQEGQLDALVKTAVPGLRDIDGQLVASMCRIGCVQRNEPPQFNFDAYVLPLSRNEWGRQGNITPSGSFSPSKYDRSIDPLPDNAAFRSFTPSVAQCERINIPQRRALKYGAWFGKTYQPEVRSSDDDRNLAESAGALHADFPVSVKRRNPTPGEIEAQIASNRRNTQSSWARFPETNDNARHVCPSYIRMRTQAVGMRMQFAAAWTNIEKFGDIVDQTDAIASIETTLLDDFATRQSAICRAEKDSANRTECKNLLHKFEQELKAFKSTQTSWVAFIDGYDAISEVRDASDFNAISQVAFLDGIETLIENGDLMREAAASALKALTAIKASTEHRTEVTSFARGLNEAANNLEALDGAPATEKILALLQTVNDDEKPPKAPISAENAAAWLALIDAVTTEEEKFTAAATKLSAAVTAAATIYNAAARGELEAYIAANGDIIKFPELVRAGKNAAFMQAQLTRMRDIRSPLNTLASVSAHQHDLSTNLESQRAAILKLDFAKPPSDQKPEIDVLEKITDKTLSGLRFAKQKYWASDTDVIDPILSAETSLKALLLQIKGRTDWKDDNKDYAQELKTLTGRISAASLPANIIDAETAKAFAGKVGAMSKLISDDTSLDDIESMFGAKGRYEHVAKVTAELRNVAKKVSVNGLASSEKKPAQQLAGAMSALKAQKTLIVETQKALRESLNFARSRQAAHNRVSYKTIAGLAAGFRIIATAISFQIASVDPDETRLRIDLAKAANLSAELANQFTARANALELQETADRRQLPTSQYLRDTQPTAFLDMYNWLEAATDDSGRTPQDRISIAKRLFENDNWARINEVYASGAGDTTMAFIRDEIGNWNLKSFENDPSALTAAYSRLTGELLERAITLAGDATTGGSVSTVSSLMKAAQDSQSGTAVSDVQTGVLIDAVDLEGFRRELYVSLEELQRDLSDPVPEGQEEAERTDAKRKVKNIIKRYEDLIDAIGTVAAAGAENKE